MPVRLPAHGPIISISDKEIEVLDIMSSIVYLMDLTGTNRLKARILSIPIGPDVLLVKLDSLYILNLTGNNRSTRADFIPLSEHKERFSIQYPEGFEFLEAFWDKDEVVSVGVKGDTYHIVRPSGIEDTKIQHAESHNFGIVYYSVYKGNLIEVSNGYVRVNGKKITRKRKLYGMPVGNFIISATWLYQVNWAEKEN